EDKQREIASKGGKAAHEKGTAHEFSSEEARQAGKKGGHHSGGNFANDREKASEAGRKGGQNSHGGGRSGRNRSRQPVYPRAKAKAFALFICLAINPPIATTPDYFGAHNPPSHFN